MFSGIVECTSKVKSVDPLKDARGIEQTSLTILRPLEWQDLKSGDSISVNGVCLTLASPYDTKSLDLKFFLGSETLQVVGRPQVGETVNLERSMQLGDRVHGHFVSGHADGTAKVVKSESWVGSWLLVVLVPKNFQNAIWKKGSIALNGVSLTVNEVSKMKDGIEVSVCLIPETLQRTNLGLLQVGSSVTFEVDPMGRALSSWIENQNNELKLNGGSHASL